MSTTTVRQQIRTISGDMLYECDVDAAASPERRLGLAAEAAVKAGQSLARADLRLANLARANLTGANLTGADLTGAYLAGVNLARANLTGANLTGANLTGAYLARANLTEANLAEANLTGADLRRADLARANPGSHKILQGPIRSDGWQFMLTNLDGEGWRIKAGCRYFTLDEAREHWQQTRGGTPLGNETFAILDALLAIAKARGWEVTE